MKTSNILLTISLIIECLALLIMALVSPLSGVILFVIGALFSLVGGHVIPELIDPFDGCGKKSDRRKNK